MLMWVKVTLPCKIFFPALKETNISSLYIKYILYRAGICTYENH